jgi:hypothetical protein
MDIAGNMQKVGSVAQIIALLINLPILLLFCGGAGWMLARIRVSRPFRFSLYFFVSAAILSLLDVAMLALNQDVRQMFNATEPAAFVSLILMSLTEYFGGGAAAA